MATATNDPSQISCRIMVLSSSIPNAASFLHLLHNRTDIGFTLTTQEPAEYFESVSLEGNELTTAPWTIKNKYYSATVHVALQAIQSLSPLQIRHIPALIFVWTQGEQYKCDIERITNDLAGHEPDVCLAVSVPPDLSVAREAPDRLEVDSEIDTFLSARGFEYIKVVDRRYSDEAQTCIDTQEDVPGLPRVLDALGTIMWPSMQLTTRTTSTQPEHMVFDWAQNSDNFVVDDLQTACSHRKWNETWNHVFQSTASVTEDPWQSGDAVISSSFPGQEFGCFDGHSLGSDDDFTAFISASPVHCNENDDSMIGEMENCSTTILSAPPPSNLYQSLGSEIGSDGESDDGDGIATKTEIMETSMRIFGEQRTAADGNDKMTNSCDPGPRDESKVFDLSNIVDTLQGLKSEIEMMTDDAERRKAAAIVALGLVYGLEGDPS